MSFLQLKPAARRLRQVAKAHAAGEMQRTDYRRVRREIIEELHVDFADPARRGANPLDGFALSGDETQKRPVQDPQTEVQSAKSDSLESASRLPGYLAVYLLLLAVIIGWSAFASAAVVKIPPVSERDPNPLNSVVVPIQGLKIDDPPSVSGINQSELRVLLRQWFDEAVAEANQLGPSGFSDVELSEVGGLLRRLGVHGEGGLDQSAVAAVNALTRRQRGRRGLSLAQLEQIAVRLEEHYRGKGYPAARAFVPAQTIAGDYAALKILPGRLSRVQVATSSRLAALAERALEGQLGAFIERAPVEGLLYQLNDLPGVTATASLRAGESVGDTALNLVLNNPAKVVPSVSFDNHGDERSARYRLNGSIDWQNPFARGDLLSFSAAQRLGPEAANSVALGYHTPGWSLGDTFHGVFSLNDFTVDPRGEQPNIEGRGSTFELGARRLLFGSRSTSLSVGLRGAAEKLELADSNQRLWWVAPQVEWHQVLDESRWVLRGSSSLVGGTISSGRFSGQPRNFIRSHSVASAWRPIGAQTMRLEAIAQIGSKDLPDSQKMLLGGVGRLTSLRPGSFVADSALVVGLEVSVTPETWRQYGSLEVFTRLGHGARTLSGDRESAFAWDGGVLWRVPDFGRFSGKLRLSVPFVVNGMEDSHDSARLLFDLAWRP